MKKQQFEPLANKDLFGSFEKNKINSLASTNLKGGTSTSLCQTDDGWWDTDSEHGQEVLADARCKGDQISEA